jgi:hypothetical protein
MSYRWEPATGSFDRGELQGADLLHEFDSKEAAEEWLALFFADLVRHGVAEVTLMEEDRAVYGPMSLLS